MNWRIYRLPGSRTVWHVDSGEGTQVLNVAGFECWCPTISVDKGNDSNLVPRAWIEIVGAHLHIINGIAEFSSVCKKAVNA